jgi:hypothetical protein
MQRGLCELKRDKKGGESVRVSRGQAEDSFFLGEIVTGVLQVRHNRFISVGKRALWSRRAPPYKPDYDANYMIISRKDYSVHHDTVALMLNRWPRDWGQRKRAK